MSGHRVMPEPIERVRMALAEVGYDPSLVWDRDGALCFGRGSIPGEVIWRAREVALKGDPSCWECNTAHGRWLSSHPWASPADIPSPCLATRRFVQDCGVDRSAIGSEAAVPPVAASDRVAEPRASRDRAGTEAPPP